jgi:hypothetical protein
MKTLHKYPYPLVILLAVAVTGTFAVTGCKKKPPVEPAPAPSPQAADATGATNDQPAAAAAPAPAPADAGTPAVVSEIPLKDASAFQSSDPKLQGLWDRAIAAAQTNGWYNTYVDLKTLRSLQGLDDTQTKYLDTTINTVGKAMLNAAKKGDPDALAAFAAFRQNRGAAAQ